MESSNESLLGQVTAVTLTLSALIEALPAQVARQAQRDLHQELEVHRSMDLETDGPPTHPDTVRTRDAVLEAFLGLLAARASGA